MFNKMNVSFDTFTNRNGTHNIIPNLKIASHKAVYNVRYKLIDLSKYDKEDIVQKFGTMNILDSVYLFNQH